MSEYIEANGHTVEAEQIRTKLISWGKENFRVFPWRMTRDPYKILVSEVMLHRTQARQVQPVYELFINQYPNLSLMVEASKEELNKVLYSLGLRWRTNLLHEMGKELMTRFKGKIPSDKGELLSLPGVSEYIAGAVRTFAWAYPEPLADTNTVRVAGRLFSLEVKDSSRRNRRFRELLEALLDQAMPRLYNYALLDLADKICLKKQEPLCEQCPLNRWCSYAQRQSRLMA